MKFDLVLALYAVVMIVLTVYALHAWIMFIYYLRARRRDRPSVEASSDFPLVCIQLPMYNEKYVVERLLEQVTKMDWPRSKLEIQVLDDSTDETTDICRRAVDKYKAEGFKIKLLHRIDRKGYKGGALTAGLSKTKAKYVAVFDADFLPAESFLKKTIPFFKDSNVAVVQSRWEHLNYDYSILTRAQAILLDQHFAVEQDMRCRYKHFMTFNGTAGVWRKKAIEDAGGWDGDCLAEDVDLSFRAQLKGWKFIYINDLRSPSELPVDVAGFKSQQFRWAKGTIQAGRKLLPDILTSKLGLIGKFEAVMHLTAHLVYPMMFLLAILTLPLLLVRNSGIDYRPYFAFMSVFSIGGLPYFGLYLLAQKDSYKNWKSRILAIPLVVSTVMALSVNNTLAVIEGFLGKASEFVRTPKYNIKDRNNAQSRKSYKTKLGISTFIELILGLYLAATAVYALLTLQFAILPFIILYSLGFLSFSFSSITAALRRETVGVAEPLYDKAKIE
ncbi:glycosyltransferase [bacterium]|nr:glycosyltransferase [bacterium]